MCKGPRLFLWLHTYSISDVRKPLNESSLFSFFLLHEKHSFPSGTFCKCKRTVSVHKSTIKKAISSQYSRCLVLKQHCCPIRAVEMKWWKVEGLVFDLVVWTQIRCGVSSSPQGFQTAVSGMINASQIQIKPALCQHHWHLYEVTLRCYCFCIQLIHMIYSSHSQWVSSGNIFYIGHLVAT